MKIGPVDGGDRAASLGDENRRRVDVQPKTPRQEEPPDSVEISSSARALSGQTPADQSGEAEEADAPESPDDQNEIELRRTKLDEAEKRIESGYYDRPEVRREIARRIADELMG
jgi:hypothetical protein